VPHLMVYMATHICGIPQLIGRWSDHGPEMPRNTTPSAEVTMNMVISGFILFDETTKMTATPPEALRSKRQRPEPAWKAPGSCLAAAVHSQVHQAVREAPPAPHQLLPGWKLPGSCVTSAAQSHAHLADAGSRAARLGSTGQALEWK
jgi:hypothetical protein